MTKNAEIILQIINGTCEHPTAEEIFLKLKAEKHRMVLATVYNSLKFLCAKGLIKRIPVEGFCDRFDRVEKHDHLCCKVCGKLIDIRLSDITQDLEAQIGEHVISYDLKINYLCPDCRKKTTNMDF
ncbi:MAG: transcriptional repressor [Spirochaetaceae bacterium]|nr:transcriptional repressor [Spirochaetaceae bacterium]